MSQNTWDNFAPRLWGTSLFGFDESRLHQWNKFYQPASGWVIGTDGVVLDPGDVAMDFSLPRSVSDVGKDMAILIRL